MSQQYTDSELIALIESQEKTLIFVYTDRCGPCKMLKPLAENACKTLGVVVSYINGDNHASFCSSMRVKSVPTLLLVENGQIQRTLTGFKNEQALTAFIAG